MALEDTGLLTQDEEPDGTTLIDACNGFNELCRLAMLWKVHYRWSAEVRFTFNCYMHWAQILFRQPNDTPVIILTQKGVTQGDTLLVVLYGITLVPLA